MPPALVLHQDENYILVRVPSKLHKTIQDERFQKQFSDMIEKYFRYKYSTLGKIGYAANEKFWTLQLKKIK